MLAVFETIIGIRLDTVLSLVFSLCVGIMPGIGCCSNFFRYIRFCGGMVYRRCGILGRYREILAFIE